MALMRFYKGRAESNGAQISYSTELSGIERVADGYRLTADGVQFVSRFVINSAGLNADSVAKMAGVDVDEAGYRLRVNKGRYFAVRSRKETVNKLIYPVPPKEGNGLGVHITVDLDGNMRLGPDSEIVGRDQIDYVNDGSRLDDFYESVKKYFPIIEKDDIVPL